MTLDQLNEEEITLLVEIDNLEGQEEEGDLEDQLDKHLELDSLYKKLYDVQSKIRDYPT